MIALDLDLGPWRLAPVTARQLRRAERVRRTQRRLARLNLVRRVAANARARVHGGWS